MSNKERLGDIAIHAVAGFAESLANHIQPNSASVAARQMGKQLAGALIAEMTSGRSKDRPHSPLTGELLRATPISDEDIVTNRLAVWNYPVPVTPELLRALNHYQQMIKESSP